MDNRYKYCRRINNFLKLMSRYVVKKPNTDKVRHMPYFTYHVAHALKAPAIPSLILGRDKDVCFGSGCFAHVSVSVTEE